MAEMGDVVHAFGAHERMSVDECLEFCRRNAAEYQDVIVIGYNHDNDLVVRSSHMSRECANFMLDFAKMHALKMLGD